MATDIGQLEDLAQQAVGRLRSVRQERDRLRSEVDELRRRVEASSAPDSDSGGASWESDRARLLAYVEETLTELRTE